MSITPTSKVLDIRGAQLGVTDSGADDLPVAISAHGLSQSRAATIRSGIGDYRLVGSPEAPGGHRRLISYDARGHGESSGSTNPADYTWPNLALDLLALADYYSPSAPVSGIGLSMGTGTLLHAVTHLPNRFDRLVLSAPSTAWQTRATQVRMYAAMADLFEHGTPDELAAAMKDAPLPAVFADVPGYGLQPDVDLSLLPAVFRGAGQTDLPPHEVIAGITQPTLIMAWATDPGHPVSTAEKLHELIAGSELVISESSADVRTWPRRAAAFLAR
ncbi:alpha/beta fold hydrolase [Subtercola lobariae]|uniref:Hydrolase n=1 Tax=Subtercola lobariae TaxID=1588641 RepID=A0A917EZQ0_9MICO|nr:alpha/beta hydrolase [Subtercola lobariae]GGF37573.1 hydrolase [Subtercola lobariae]